MKKVKITDLSSDEPKTNYTIDTTSTNSEFLNDPTVQKPLNLKIIEPAVSDSTEKIIKLAAQEVTYLKGLFYNVNLIKDTSGTSPYISQLYAKECALIYANGILKACQSYSAPFWEEVKRQLIDEIPKRDFELRFCQSCFQMTNHINNICQKCENKFGGLK